MSSTAQPQRPLPPAHGSGRRERFRWLMFASVLFLLSTAAVIHWGLAVMWGTVPNRSATISPADHAFATAFRERLVADHAVKLSSQTDFAWDTVCLIEPFDLDEATLHEAMRAGHLPDGPIVLPDGPIAIPQPNWMFAFLQAGRLVRTIEFHHREIEPRHGAYCVPREQASFANVRHLASEVWIDLVKP